jgi:ATP/maltotriose-dependent transcriptional regulator MalT
MAGRAHANLHVVARTRGDLAAAAAHVEEALRRDREAGYAAGVILSMLDLGDVARDRGDAARALGLYQEALGRFRGHPDTRMVNEAIEGVATVAAAVGQPQRAARLLGAAAAQRERIGLVFSIAPNQAARERAMAAARAGLGEPAFAAAWAAGRELSGEQALGEALEPFEAPVGPPTVSLTPREAEILPLLAAGRTDREIGAALFLSHRPVENHIVRLTALKLVRRQGYGRAKVDLLRKRLLRAA